MSTTDLERRLADALREQADEVIAGADTQGRHRDLMRELRHESARHHAPRRDVSRIEPSRPVWRVWAAGLAAAAAVALVVSLPALLPRPTEDRESPARIPEVSAIRVARDFVDAFASFDRERAASYLADDAELHIWPTRVGEDAWRIGNRWLEAVGGQVILNSCQLTGTSALGTLVECAFDWHALHSAELGYEPNPGGLFMFTVDDDMIVWARQSGASDVFDLQVWQPFADWVLETHPEAAPAMYADWPNQGYESLTPRSIELWGELSREWVREQRR